MCDSHQPLNGSESSGLFRDADSDWHSPQCKRRALSGLGGCWCDSIPVNNRFGLDAEEESRKLRTEAE